MCRPELRLAVEREKHRLEMLIEALLEHEQSRAPFDVVALEARREVSIAGGQFEMRIDRIDSIEGGGCAILDYKSGEPRALRWQGDGLRDPQLFAYLLAEARPQRTGAGQCRRWPTAARRFSGKSMRTRACCPT